MNIVSENPMYIRPMVNVGATFDIPTGTFIEGVRGEHILNGGLGGVTGVVGQGNSFKSTISHYLMLTAADRTAYSGIPAPMHTYDTEDNMHVNLGRLNKLAARLENLPKNPLDDQEIWSIITKSQMNVEEWLDIVYKVVNAGKKDKKNYVEYTGFYNKITQALTKLHRPSFVEIDSLTLLEGNKTAALVGDGSISESNMLYMQQGLVKSKLLMELPRLTTQANMYFLLTAHTGVEKAIASGPFAPQPKKALQFLKAGDKIKGVSDNMLYLTTQIYHSSGTTNMMNRDTKLPDYPKDKIDVGTDLNLVKLTQLRNKSGPSGYTLEVVVSQREGVLPSLTEFNALKKAKFGFEGNNLSYNLVILPEVKLSRTKVRSKIDSDPKLRRALNFTSEYLQMTIFMQEHAKYYIGIEEVYKGITDNGFDWDIILTKTRGWWSIDQYAGDLYFLSTLDILMMASGDYKPWWYDKVKKQQEKAK